MEKEEGPGSVTSKMEKEISWGRLRAAEKGAAFQAGSTLHQPSRDYLPGAAQVGKISEEEFVAGLGAASVPF